MTSWAPVSRWTAQLLDIAKEFAGSGPIHRRRLSDIDIRISVSGVRGKSTAVRWLHEILYERGYDTYAKVTGINPISIYNGSEYEIERSIRVRLYENERQFRQFDPVDAAIVENQGIRQYTTRLVNEQFVRPQVVFITNIREDHLDTLGENRLKIARSLARSIPGGTHVICGEQNETLRDYFDEELGRRDGTLSYVHVPAEHRTIPGAELIYGMSPVLQAVGEEPIDDAKREAFLERMNHSWVDLPNGRVFNAAAINDIQSIELVRRYLVDDSETPIQPLLYLRSDRRGRTVSFLRYLESLADRDLVKQVRVVGQDTELFALHATFPVVIHDESESPAAVLDDALADDWPLILMGNTVAEFMQDLAEIIANREREATTEEVATSSPMPVGEI